MAKTRSLVIVWLRSIAARHRPRPQPETCVPSEPAQSAAQGRRFTLHCIGTRESYIHGVHATAPIEQTFTLFADRAAGRWYDWTSGTWHPMASVDEHGYVLSQVDHGAMAGRSMILIHRPGLEWSVRSSNFEMSLQIDGRCRQIALRLPPQLPGMRPPGAPAGSQGAGSRGAGSQGVK